jgi:asparagine synthase (glutamine-hydrolysing)
MCGILGVIDATGAPFAEADGRRLLPLLRHRGPDGDGVFTAPGLLLGHLRLAFLDLSPAGAQPMTTPDGRFTITFNGEIYNHLELRQRLPSTIDYRGHSDTETLLHAFAAWGPRCLDELRGMFAFAIYDRERKSLFLARDRVGKKPLLYWHDAIRGRLAFASEMRVLTALGAPHDIDAEAVAMYLRVGYIPSPHTIFSAVRKLPPGHYLQTDGRQLTLRRYHQLQYQPKRVLDHAAATREVRELLTTATRRRLLSDRPLGALLSGGVDSTAVTAAMARLSAQPVHSFSMGFANWGGTELPYAEEVARTLGTDHRSFTISHTSLESLLPTLAWHYGEPFGDPSAIPSFCLSSLTRRYVVGALVGDGGDESFMGYRRYRIGRMRERVLRVPARLRNAVAAPLDYLTSWRSRRARLAVEGFRGGLDQLFVARTGRFRGVPLQRLLSPAFAESIGDRDPRTELVHDLWQATDCPETGEKMMAVDAQLYLPDQLLVKMDIASMAHSLEIRAPFLDTDLMEQVATMPEALKLTPTRFKAILIDSIDEMPASFFARRKQGFSPPVERWLTGESRSYARDILLDPATERRGLLRRTTVEDLLNHMDQFPDIAHDLYLLLVLEVWARTCLDNVSSSPPAAHFDWTEQHMPPPARSARVQA